MAQASLPQQPSQALARKWRPRAFAQLVGQEHVVRALTNALEQQRLHHAYLFTGTRGVGKTTLARIIAKALNCEVGVGATPCGRCPACVAIDAGRFVDLIELDAASNTQVDNMRELLENALYAPTQGRYKIYIIDEVHMLSRSAFNAMLKTLEEPPAHVKFVLATTDPQKIPVTVLSRCLQFNLKQIPRQQIKAQLGNILAQEQVQFDDEALDLLSRAAGGSMRDALSLLDQAIAHGGGRVEKQAVRAMLGSVDRDHLRDILQALRARDGAVMISVADKMSERGLSFDLALQELAVLLHRIALCQTVPDAAAADQSDLETLSMLASAFSAEEVQLYYQIVLHGRRDIGLAPDEYAGFTMTLMRLLAFAPDAAEPAVAHLESKPRSAAIIEPPLKKKLSAGDWTDLVQRLPLAGMERMLAHNCELVSWDESQVVLRVPEAQRHLAQRAYQDRLQTALQQQLGGKFRLDIAIGTARSDTVAEIQDKEQRKRVSAAAADIERDPFVRDLVQQLDARVVASTIKPLP